MKQQKLKALLVEATDPKCSWKRRNEINRRIADATATTDELHTLSESLFLDTVMNRPELLTTLFPIFAIICGDRKEGFLYTDMDWSLI